MPLSTFLKSAAGTCPFCNQKAGILSCEHPDCRRTFQVGWNEMVNHTAQAAASHTFDEKTLRLSKAEIARRSCRDGKTVSQAAEEGCGPLHCQQPPVIGRWYTIELVSEVFSRTNIVIKTAYICGRLLMGNIILSSIALIVRISL